MSGQGKILVISGPAGVGKSSICARLLQDPRFVVSVSATTRPPRGQEQDGVHYHFLSREEFQSRADKGHFLEWATVHGKHLYGTLADPVYRELAAGKHALLDIDVQGAATLREKGVPVVTVFLEPPSLDELRERLEGRGDTSPEDIARRLETARLELKESWRYDLVVVNDDLDLAVGKILEYVERA